ncbi:hypothetical protein [Flavobacterium sp. WG21]|uniref:hypothetical protein n=1 Tax=Flavobacterium sp. WG21 TaxID=1229487 RepID=UPI00034AAA77|nr:hypothetical protein [Flavobacterium sp. WG21]
MNYYAPFLTLLIALFTFHFVFIKYSPQGKRFWKKVDYAWVSLGVIGIFGATFSLNKEYFTALTPWHKKSLEFVYTEYMERLENQRDYFLNKNGFDYEEFNDQKQAKRFIQAGKIYDSLLKMSQNYRDKILVEEEFAYVDSLSRKHNNAFANISDDDGYIKRNHDLSNWIVDQIVEESNEISAAKEQSRRGTFSWMLLFISPYLFALAIAIRITKVTAELKEIK